MYKNEDDKFYSSGKNRFFIQTCRFFNKKEIFWQTKIEEQGRRAVATAGLHSATHLQFSFKW